MSNHDRYNLKSHKTFYVLKGKLDSSIQVVIYALLVVH